MRRYSCRRYPRVRRSFGGRPRYYRVPRSYGMGPRCNHGRRSYGTLPLSMLKRLIHRKPRYSARKTGDNSLLRIVINALTFFLAVAVSLLVVEVRKDLS